MAQKMRFLTWRRGTRIKEDLLPVFFNIHEQHCTRHDVGQTTKQIAADLFFTIRTPRLLLLLLS